MARRKSRYRKTGGYKRPRPVNLRRKGRKFFRLGNYNQAIADWEQEQKRRPHPKITAALAEAYFRRGVKQRERDDLETAVSLQPDNPIYAYYLGLAEHRDGDLSKAIAAYQRVQKINKAWAKRVAYVLALVYQQQGQDPARQAVWSQLSPAERQQFQRVRRFQQKKSDRIADEPIVWRGVAAYANGRYAESQKLLKESSTQSVEPGEAALAHHYLGCLAARQENLKTAVSHWEKARANQFNAPSLLINLGETHHRLAEDAVQRQKYPDALEYGLSALSLKGDNDNQLNQLVSHIYQQIGYQSANSGHWDEALAQWELAEEQGKGNFRLACNLALACEQTDDYAAAAERWREALRRRPRKADHPDAISDEEVARMWIRTAVAYQKTQQHDEANQVMKQAVKWQPDNLDIRLALVDGFVNNGQLQAAENELGRILERDENNVPALIRMGELLSHSEHWWHSKESVDYWERVLELEPNNETALQLLVEYYQNLGDHWTENWFLDYQQALTYYNQGLQYQPDNAELLITIAKCHFALDDADEGESTLNRVMELPLTKPETALKLIVSWHIAALPDKAVAMMPALKQKFPQQTLFIYLMVAVNCLLNDYSDWADPWIELAQTEHPDDPIYLMLSKMLMANDAPMELVKSYLQKALEFNQKNGEANLLLGTLYATEGDLATARKYWKTAKRIASKSKDAELKKRIAEAEEMFNNPLHALLRFMEDIGFDDEDFDDDDYF